MSSPCVYNLCRINKKRTHTPTTEPHVKKLIMISKIKLLYTRIAIIAVSQPTIYARVITSALVPKPLSEFVKPMLKMSRISLAPPSRAKVNALILDSIIARLNNPRCDTLFPLRDGIGEGPLGVVLDGSFIIAPAQL